MHILYLRCLICDFIFMQGQYKIETAEQTAPTGNTVRQASLDLEKSMVEAADKAEATVQEINNITFSLEAGSGILSLS